MYVSLFIASSSSSSSLAVVYVVVKIYNLNTLRCLFFFFLLLLLLDLSAGVSTDDFKTTHTHEMRILSVYYIKLYIEGKH